MSNNDKRRKKTPPTTVVVRIIALFLTLLMVLGVVAILIPGFSQLYAAPASATSETCGDLTVAVGLMYAGGVTVGFDVRAQDGFILGSIVTEGTDKHTFSPLWELSETYITAVCDSNLTRTDDDYAMTAASQGVVGGYHVQMGVSSADQAKTVIAEWNTILAASGSYAFACHVNGSYAVRAGSCLNISDADAVRAVLQGKGYSGLSVVSPTKTAVGVVDLSTNRILFEYDGNTASTLGVQARQLSDTERYLVTPASNLYRGIFKFTRSYSDAADGLALTNVLSLEDYVEGVLPWEIGASWPKEVTKAFAVAARTFAVSSMRSPKHATFDVCCTTCCQVYRGVHHTEQGRQFLRECVRATQGQVMTYTSNGVTSYVTAAYSSSMGGTTNSAAGAWRSSGAGYLIPICTPWEKYENVLHGSWTVEYTPAQLKRKLQIYYPQLTADIASVQITKCVEQSSYVWSVTVTDQEGHTAKIEGGDRLRSYLSLYSANFVVGTAGSVVDRVDYALADRYAQEFLSGEPYPIPPADGEELPTDPQYSLTNLPDIAKLSTQTVPVTTQVTLTGTAGNFVFAGRGWGHGVGMSAYGAYDLAKMGYSHKAILTTYYQGIELSPVTEHSYTDECDTTCNNCGSVRVAPHKIDETWKQNSANHFRECSLCHTVLEQEAHVYTDECDSTCHVCDYRRTPPHRYVTVTSEDGTQSWEECELCHNRTDGHVHIYDDEFDAECNGCGHIRYLVGDYDENGQVDSDDAVYLLFHLYFPEDYAVSQPPRDFDGSANIDSDDAVYLLFYVYFPDEYPLS